MAIYEYECATCGGRFEAMQSMASAPLSTCGELCVAKDHSGKGRVARQFSVPNIGKSGGGGSGGGDAGGGGDDPSCGSCGRVGPDVCN